MLSLLIFISYIISPFLIYHDATRNGIKHQANGKFFDFSPIGWVVLSLILWPIAIIGYVKFRVDYVSGKERSWIDYVFIALLLTAVVNILALFSWLVTTNSARPVPSVPQGSSDLPATNQSYISPLDQLVQAKPDAILPQGEIAEIFSYGSDFTDLQRQLKFKDIHGKVIEWRLPVYEVKQSGDGYTIQTSGHAKGELFGPKYIGTFLSITPRSEDDRRFVERIKTGDYIKVKGVIEDVTMRNLDIRPAIIIDDERIPRQILGKVYGKYIPKYDCWHTVEYQNGEQQYCMKLGRLDTLQIGNVRRIYVLALGDNVDDEYKRSGIHAQSGLVGAFVAEIQNGNAEIVASNAKILMGAYGKPPDTWKFVKLSPNDYWGWQSANRDCHFDCVDEHIILAPYGKSVKDLAGFGGYINDEASVSIALTIDSSPTSTKVYPLLLEVTKEKEGKEVSRKTVKAPFDEKNWQWVYTEP